MRWLAATCIALAVPALAQEDGIPWIHSYDEGVAQAREEQKPLFVEFYADWCGPCRQMDAEVYSQPDIVKALEDYVCIKVDVDAAMNVAAAYEVHSIPRFVVIAPTEKVVGDQIGFVNKSYFLSMLEMIEEDIADNVEGAPMPEVAAGPKPEAPPEDRVAKAEGIDDWLKLLGDPDPKVREAAGAELVKRGGTGAWILVEALASDYLGTRIGAYEALSAHELGDLPFDPWAQPAERKTALKAWHVWRDKQLASSAPVAPPEQNAP